MKNAHGFTLIELLITIALLAVVVGIALPNMRLIVLNNRATGQANELVAALNYARSEAMKRGRIVELCRSTTTESATPACAGGSGTDYATGYLVRVRQGGEVLRVWQPLPAGAVLTGPANPVGFTSTGMQARAAGSSAMPTAVTFVSRVHGCRGNMRRDIVVAPTGAVQTTRGDC